ncbi:TPA: hypothetical protein ACUQ2M_004148 [Escherichia coli]
MLRRSRPRPAHCGAQRRRIAGLGRSSRAGPHARGHAAAWSKAAAWRFGL